jgi:hypothetical protein
MSVRLQEHTELLMSVVEIRVHVLDGAGDNIIGEIEDSSDDQTRTGFVRAVVVVARNEKP